MKRISAALFMAVLVACGGDKVDNEALKNRVLDTHDEVMPKMGQVMNLKKKVIAKANELEVLDNDHANIAELRDLAVDLEKAYQGMVTWMHQWSENADPHISGKATAEETTAFYRAEQKKVDQVKADINASIEKAEKALQ